MLGHKDDDQSQIRHISGKDGGHFPASSEKDAIPGTRGRGNDGKPVVASLGSILAGLLHGLRGFSGAGVAPSTGPRRRPRETSDFLSHDKGRRAFHLLPGGRAERSADAPPAARISFVIADVRAAFRPTFRSLSLGRARLSRVRTQRLAGSEDVQLYLRPYRVGDGRLHPVD